MTSFWRRSRVKPAADVLTDERAKTARLKAELADACAWSDALTEENNGLRDQLRTVKSELRNAKADFGVWKRAADAVTAEAEQQRLRAEKAETELAVMRLDPGATTEPIPAWTPAAGTFDDRTALLRERARANDLAAQLAVVQRGNMTADVELFKLRRELDKASSDA